jgi:hypothetical protein
MTVLCNINGWEGGAGSKEARLLLTGASLELEMNRNEEKAQQ